MKSGLNKCVYFRRRDDVKHVISSTEIKSLLVKYLSALLDRSGSSSRSSSQSMTRSLSAESSIPNYMGIVKHMFAFAYIWGFGGNLHDRCAFTFTFVFMENGNRQYNIYTVIKASDLVETGGWADELN